MLALIRHGESVWVAEGRFQGRGDPPLSELGTRQAELVARRLAHNAEGAPLPLPSGPPLAVWHSPLRRAADSARLIAAAQTGAVDLRRSDALTELGQGAWEGLLHHEVSARWPEELRRWRLSPTQAVAPGGEPLLQAAERVRSALVEIVHELSAAGDRAPPTPPADRAGDVAALRRSPVPGYPSAAAGERVAGQWGIIVAHDGVFRLLLMTLLGVAYERFWSFPFHLSGVSVISLSEGVAALRAHNLAEHLAPLSELERAAEEARGERRGAL